MSVLNRIAFIFLLFVPNWLLGQDTLRMGSERMDTLLPLLQGKRVGLVVNHTSLVGQTHLVDTLLALGVAVQVIFAPEHGFRGQAEAGATIKDSIDNKTGIQLISIYGKKKKPSLKDLQQVDIVVFDIQDIGVRFYTYISTLLYVAEACAAHEKPLIVLDRPNPNGHYVDGPVLQTSLRSFVGVVPIPIVHGCTVGELARMYKGERWLDAADRLDLCVITCLGYTHATRYAPPVKPSPNMPDIRSILLYPSICLFEGTKVSVGRGTDLPFQRFGYPDCPVGMYSFTPVPNSGSVDPPYNNRVCYGFDLSTLSLDSLYTQRQIDLQWYLLMFQKSPRKDDFFLSSGFFDKLAGTHSLRTQIESNNSPAQIRSTWMTDLAQYKKMRKQYLLYPDVEE
jgi:uncharacterized protein YbbC (DUF1343 family)